MSAPARPRAVILGSGALAAHVQGSFFFATGVNGGVKTTVKSVVPGVSWQLVIPAPETPATDDAFVVF